MKKKENRRWLRSKHKNQTTTHQTKIEYLILIIVNEKQNDQFRICNSLISNKSDTIRSIIITHYS